MRNKRSAIMDECPDDFRDTLSGFIDDIESQLGSGLDYFKINSLSDLNKIEDGVSFLVDLKDSLY
jgi:hypothetical protein